MRKYVKYILRRISPQPLIIGPSVIGELTYPRVDLFHWRPSVGTNFGDFLSRVVVELMLGSRGITLEDQANDARQLLAIGSVMHFARPGAVVWGSGVNGKVTDEKNTFSKLDVRAVRGPLTRRYLVNQGIEVPEIYGDPGLLLPLLTKNRFAVTREKAVVFVPNLNDISKLSEASLSGTPIILPTQSWNKCVSEILKARFVAASSLHGLIVAEAFGIPARYVRLEETEHLFKYEDYYRGTGRDGFKFARSVLEAVEMGGEDPPLFDSQALINAFPFDLW